MGLVREKGAVALYYDHLYTVNASAPAVSNILVIDGSTEKITFVGSVFHPTIETGTINIRKVHFRSGAVSVGANSEIRVSLQNLSATAGPPYQGDGTQDQTYDFKTANTTINANSWNETGNLSADRAVDLSADSPGDANSRWLAVVIEYQVFTAADSVTLQSIANNHSTATHSSGLGGGCVLNGVLQGGRTAIVALECDDGSFAFIQGAYPVNTFGSASVASNGAIRRAGVKFKVPTTRKIDRAGLYMLIPNGCDGSFKLYGSDGTTELASIDVDNDAVSVAGAVGHESLFQPVTLTADTYYRFVFVAGTTTAGTVYHADVNEAGLMDGFYLGQDAHWTQHDGVSWSDTTTRRPIFALGVSAMHDGAAPPRPHVILGV